MFPSALIYKYYWNLNVLCHYETHSNTLMTEERKEAFHNSEGICITQPKRNSFSKTTTMSNTDLLSPKYILFYRPVNS